MVFTTMPLTRLGYIPIAIGMTGFEPAKQFCVVYPLQVVAEAPPINDSYCMMLFLLSYVGILCEIDPTAGFEPASSLYQRIAYLFIVEAEVRHRSVAVLGCILDLNQ